MHLRTGWPLALVPAAAPAQAIDAPRRLLPRSKSVFSSANSLTSLPCRLLSAFPLTRSAIIAPGAIYLGARNTLASLGFLDEDHLLFTFRVPGLLHRDTANGEDSDERQIRAVVLTLPKGTVETEASWTLHDRSRYLWMLCGRPLPAARPQSDLLESDASLTLKPLLDFPGPLLWLELDPAQQLLVTNSREPATRSPNPATRPASQPGTQPATPPRPASPPTTIPCAVNRAARFRRPHFAPRLRRRSCWSAASAPPFIFPSTPRVPRKSARPADRMDPQLQLLHRRLQDAGHRRLHLRTRTTTFFPSTEILVTGCGPTARKQARRP